MDLVVSGSNQLKALCRAVNCLARVGTELMMEAYSEQVVLHTMNAARSALFAVTFKPQFFDVFQVVGSGIKCSILLKSVCSVLRTAAINIDKLSISVPNDEAVKVKWSLACINGITKTYWISCSQESESIGAILDRTRFSSHLVVKPRDLNRLLVNFQATLQEITLIATEPLLTPASEYASQPPEVKAVELRSFVDPIKDNTDASLHTQLWIDPREELQEYSHSGEAVDVTFSLKELKAMLAFCEGAEAGMHMYFDKAGDPVLFAPRFGPGDHTVLSDYDATMVLATMLDSVLPQTHRDDAHRENETSQKGNATKKTSSPQQAAASSAQNCDAKTGELRTPAREGGGDGGPSRLDSAPESAQRSDRTHVWSDLSAVSNARVSQSNIGTGDRQHASAHDKGAVSDGGIADAGGLFDSEPATEEVNLDARRWTNHRQGAGTGPGPQRSQETPVPAGMRYSAPSHLARPPYTPQPDCQGVARQVIFDKDGGQPAHNATALQKMQASIPGKGIQESFPRQPAGNMLPNQGGGLPHSTAALRHTAVIADQERATNAEELRRTRAPDNVPETETPRPTMKASDLFVMDSEEEEEDDEDCVHSTPPEKRGRIL